MSEAPFDDDDPFAAPLFDLQTGELVDDDERELTLEPSMSASQLVAYVAPRLVSDSQSFVVELRDALRQHVTSYAEHLHAQRTTVDRVDEHDVAREVVELTSAHDTLRAVASAFTSAADVARDCLTELTLEVRGDRVEREGGSASIRVGSGAGDVRVVVTQPTETSVLDDVVLDVIVGAATQQALAEAIEAGATATTPTVVAYAARIAVERYRALTSPPKWKLTALQQWRRELEARGDAAASKLASAFGKRKRGSLSTRIERVESESA